MKNIKLLLVTLFMAAAMSITAFAGSWNPDGPSWSYTKDDGNRAISEWITDAGKWYYLDEKGIMRTGWLFDHNKWYFLGLDGAMFVNKYTPKQQYCGPDGAWIRNYNSDDNSSSDDSSSSSSNSSSNTESSGQNDGNSSGGGASSELLPGQSTGPS